MTYEVDNNREDLFCCTFHILWEIVFMMFAGVGVLHLHDREEVVRYFLIAASL